MLGTQDPDQKSDWKKYIPSLVHAYNCTRHDSTGFSPYELMFNRQPRLPFDLLLGSEPPQSSIAYSSFVDSMKQHLNILMILLLGDLRMHKGLRKEFMISAPGEMSFILVIVFLYVKSLFKEAQDC